MAVGTYSAFCYVLASSSALSFSSNFHVKLVWGLGLENGAVGDGGQHVLNVLLRLGILLNSVPLVNLHVNSDNVCAQQTGWGSCS